MKKVMSNPPKDGNFIKYHEGLTRKYNSFVLVNDNKANGIEVYYTDALKGDALNDALNIRGAVYIQVYDCSWKSKEWNVKPYKYTYIKSLDELYVSYAHPSTEKPNHFTYDPAAVYKNGELLEMYFRQKQENTTYFISLLNKDDDLYFLNTRFPGHRVTFSGKEGDVNVKYDGKATSITYSYEDFVKYFDQREVYTLLEKMLNRRNYHGFYDELFTHVQKAFKVDFGINYFKN